MRRVAVTGIGVVSPLGHSVQEIFDNAQHGRSAVRVIGTPAGNQRFETLAATVEFNPAEHFEPMMLRMLDRVTQFGMVAARRALVDSNHTLTEVMRAHAGVFVGTGMGASLTLDEGYQRLYDEKSARINPLTILLGMHNAPAAWIAIENQLRGPNLTYSTACSSSSVAIGEAWLRLAHGDVDIAIAGGAEAPLSFGSLMAWKAMRAVANIDTLEPSASCKPFSKDRSGMVLGEGAAMVILEPLEHARARGAPVYGEILGYGLTTDVAHIARPSVEAQTAAVRAALQSAKLEPT